MVTATQLIAGLIGTQANGSGTSANTTGAASGSGGPSFASLLDVLRNSVSATPFVAQAGASHTGAASNPLQSNTPQNSGFGLTSAGGQINVTDGNPFAALNISDIAPLSREQLAQLLSANGAGFINVVAPSGDGALAGEQSAFDGNTFIHGLVQRLEEAGLPSGRVAQIKSQLADVVASLQTQSGATAPATNTAGGNGPVAERAHRPQDLDRMFDAIAAGEVSIPTEVLDVIQQGGSTPQFRHALAEAGLLPQQGAATLHTAEAPFMRGAGEPIATSHAGNHTPGKTIRSSTLAKIETGEHDASGPNVSTDDSHPEGHVSPILPTAAGDVTAPTLEQTIVPFGPAPTTSGEMSGQGATTSAHSVNGTPDNVAAQASPLQMQAAEIVEAGIGGETTPVEGTALAREMPATSMATVPGTTLAANAQQSNTDNATNADAPEGSAAHDDNRRTGIAELVPQLRAGNITVDQARETLVAAGFPQMAAKLDRFMANARPLNAGPVGASTAPASVQPNVGYTLGNAPAAAPAPTGASAAPVTQGEQPQIQRTGLGAAVPSSQPAAATGQAHSAPAQQAKDGLSRTISNAPFGENNFPAADKDGRAMPSVRPEAASVREVRPQGLDAGGRPNPAVTNNNANGLAAPAVNTASQPDQPINPGGDRVTTAQPQPLADGMPEPRTADRPMPLPTANHSVAPATSMPISTDGAPVQTGHPVTQATSGHGTGANNSAHNAAHFDPATRAAAVHDMSVAITRFAAQGLSRFQIRLDPAELGRVDVRLEMARDGRVTAHVMTDRPETMDMLRQDARVLERAFQDAGLKTDQNSLNFSLRDQNGGANQGRDGNANPTWVEGADEDDQSPAQTTELEMVPDEITGGLRVIGDQGIDVRI